MPTVCSIQGMPNILSEYLFQLQWSMTINNLQKYREVSTHSYSCVIQIIARIIYHCWKHAWLSMAVLNCLQKVIWLVWVLFHAKFSTLIYNYTVCLMITTHGQKHVVGGKIGFLSCILCWFFYYMPKFIGYLKLKTHHFLKEEEYSKVQGLQKWNSLNNNTLLMPSPLYKNNF